MTLRNRLARRVGWGIGLALIAPMAWAQSPSGAAAAVPLDGKRVAIDPATGQVRPFEADDGVATSAAKAPAPAAAPAAGLMSRIKGGAVVSATGARGVRLSPEHLNFTRVTRLPDGSLSMNCTVGESAEAHAHHAGAAAQPNRKGAADVE